MTNEELDKKIEFMKAIEKAGYPYGTYKLIFKSKGKYGEPEAWFYKKYNGIVEKPGILIEETTLTDIGYLKEYLA